MMETPVRSGDIEKLFPSRQCDFSSIDGWIRRDDKEDGQVGDQMIFNNPQREERTARERGYWGIKVPSTVRKVEGRVARTKSSTGAGITATSEDLWRARA